MIKERAMELVAALRSGKYQQTDGKLSHAGKFCCLGVACDISNLTQWVRPHDDLDTSPDSYFNEESLLPDRVMEYFGFASNNGHIGVSADIELLLDPDDELGGTVEGDNLVDFNDGGASFAQIADLIEKHWEQM